MGAKWLKRVGIATALTGLVAGAAVHFDLANAIDGAQETRHVPPIQDAAVAPAPRELATVEVTTVEPTDMGERLRVSGELRPVNQAIIKAKVSGTVLEVTARQGQPVKSGDVLVRFETEDLESALIQQDSNLDAARAQLTLAEQTLAKVEPLAKKGYSTKAALERRKVTSQPHEQTWRAYPRKRIRRNPPCRTRSLSRRSTALSPADPSSRGSPQVPMPSF